MCEYSPGVPNRRNSQIPLWIVQGQVRGMPNCVHSLRCFYQVLQRLLRAFGITRPSSLGYPGSKTQMSHFRRCICEASLPSALPKVVRSFERNGCFVVKRNNSRSVVCPWPVSRRGGGEEIASLCGPAEAAHLLSSWRLIS